MYHDRSLVPGEAIRLLALGVLMEGDKRYADLAMEIRFFTQRIVGPSLDLLGSSLRLLQIEGLTEATGASDDEDQACLRITPAGRQQFENLMSAQLRAPINDVGHLTLLLKLRFLDFLPTEAQEDQLDLIGDIVRSERARAAELAKEYAGRPMADWLAIDVEQAERRLAWLENALDAFG